MDVTIKNAPLCGEITAPPSKSDAHRALICAALADSPVAIKLSSGSEDIYATIACLEALGAEIETTEQGIVVHPVKKSAKSPVLDCGESGSTLRFLLPVAAVAAENARFEGRGRLPERPIGDILRSLEENGCFASGRKIPLSLQGELKAGVFRISGDVSSQFVSGLLMALPVLQGESRIVLTTPLESAAYVDMTINTLKRFGVQIVRNADGYSVPGCQIYRSQVEYEVEGDWSGAAFFAVADMIGGSVKINGLRADSAQPDKAIESFSKGLPAEVDVSEFPDLFPVLAVLACSKRGDTLLKGASRLRIKESDRIVETARFVKDLGGAVDTGEDFLLVHGKGRLRGGITDSANDHRIAMSAAIAAGICDGPVTVTGAEAVNKSYPGFWQEIKKLEQRKGEN